MRALLCILAAGSIVTIARGDAYFPADHKKPLFRIFAPISTPTAADAPRSKFTFDDEHPLLVVHSVSDLMLARDNKGVLITLTSEDGKKFAEITRKYNDALLLLEADGHVLQVMHITAPITDGIIGLSIHKRSRLLSICVAASTSPSS